MKPRKTSSHHVPHKVEPTLKDLKVPGLVLTGPVSSHTARVYPEVVTDVAAALSFLIRYLEHNVVLHDSNPVLIEAKERLAAFRFHVDHT